MKHIEQQWLEYQRQVLPADASEIQIRECKRAFFAGARALETLLLTHLEDGDQITDAELKLVKELRDELSEFVMDQFGKAERA
jgi:hypothetical protein